MSSGISGKNYLTPHDRSKEAMRQQQTRTQDHNTTKAWAEGLRNYPAVSIKKQSQIVPIQNTSLPKFDPQITYIVIDRNFEVLDHLFVISCRAKTVFENIGNPSIGDFFVREEDIQGIPRGDYVEQCGKFLAHSPSEIPQDVLVIEDFLQTMLAREKHYNNGSVEWDIPTIFTNQDGKVLKRLIVKQKFTLENGILSFSKSGKELLQANLNTKKLLR